MSSSASQAIQVASIAISDGSSLLKSNDINEQDEHEVSDKFTVPPGSSNPIIAVDLDDVLCETNKAVSKWHNEVYGTKMDISNFYYYYYWKNPYWGTVKEMFDKVGDFYKTDRIYHTTLVPGAREGIQALKDMGFRLIIVTARPEDADRSWKWVSKHFPGLCSPSHREWKPEWI